MSNGKNIFKRERKRTWGTTGYSSLILDPEKVINKFSWKSFLSI